MPDSTNARVTQETLDLIKGLLANGSLAKATTFGITQATGLVNFDLEPRAKYLFPVITPIRNSIPRAKGQGDTATHYRTIVAINPSRQTPGVSEGNRGSVIDQTEVDRIATYKGLGLENSLTEEAMYAAEGFDDALRIMGDILLYAVMIAEEEIILQGNNSLQLGTPVAPTGVGSATGGTIAASAANACQVVALTYDGWKRATVATGVVTTFNKSNADGTTDSAIGGGSSAASLISGVIVTAGATSSITWSATAVKGAVAYAWYTGTGAQGTLALNGITTINQFVQTAVAAGTQLASVVNADNSTNRLVFDGLITQTQFTPPAGASGYSSNTYGYWTSLNGAFLTGNSDGSITEIDNALQLFWETFRVTPTKIRVNAQEARNITKKVFASGTTAAFQVKVASGADQAGLTGASFVGAYYNKFAPGGPVALPIEVHPNLPPGQIFFDCESIPYPLANIPGPRRIKARREFYQTLWPQTTRTRFTGVYVDELLQVYTPFALGVISNIGNG